MLDKSLCTTHTSWVQRSWQVVDGKIVFPPKAVGKAEPLSFHVSDATTVLCSCLSWNSHAGLVQHIHRTLNYARELEKIV